MPQEEVELRIRRWFDDVWNVKREDAIAEMLAEDVIMNGLQNAEGKTVSGLEEYKVFYRAFLSAFPDLEFTVEDVFVQEDKVAIRCTVRATHDGDGLQIPATNRKVEFTGLGIAKLENDKIIETWNEFDFVKMYSQLGVNLK